MTGNRQSSVAEPNVSQRDFVRDPHEEFKRKAVAEAMHRADERDRPSESSGVGPAQWPAPGCPAWADSSRVKRTCRDRWR